MSDIKELKVGDTLPPFLAIDQERYEVTDEDVIGTPLVLYFYPKDGTPICTEEACSIRDQMATFDDLQTLIIGVSPDNVDSHQAFIKENKLEFSLLSDEKMDMFRMFGAVKGDDIERTTFLVNSEGVVVWMEKPVDVKGHTERIVKAILEHCKDEVINFDDLDRDYAEFMEKSLGEAPDKEAIRKKILKDYNLTEDDLKEKK